MKGNRSLSMMIMVLGCGTNAFGGVGELALNANQTLADEKLKNVEILRKVRCFPHCAVRTVQESRIWCTESEGPAHIGGQGPSWEYHEEHTLVTETVYIDADCRETVLRRTEQPLDDFLYWPEDDIFHPTSYYDSPFYRFDCAGGEVIYRIVVGYRLTGCAE